MNTNAKHYLSLVFVVILVINSFLLVLCAQSVVTTNLSTSLETSLKIGDFADYQLSVYSAYKAYPNGSYIQGSEGGETSFSNQNGDFKWTVIDENSTYVHLKLDLSIPGFFVDSREILVSHRIAYALNNETLGYIPFWIPISNWNNNQQLILGSLGNNSLLYGKAFALNTNDYILGGYREENWFEQVNTIANAIGQLWFYLKANGLLTSSDGYQLFWSTLKYPYAFDLKMSLVNTNIDLGPINYFASIVAFLLQGGFIIIIALIVFVSVAFFARRSQKRHNKKLKTRNELRNEKFMKSKL